jgi:negative regulator of sigma E activity
MPSQYKDGESRRIRRLLEISWRPRAGTLELKKRAPELKQKLRPWTTQNNPGVVAAVGVVAATVGAVLVSPAPTLSVETSQNPQLPWGRTSLCPELDQIRQN